MEPPRTILDSKLYVAPSTIPAAGNGLFARRKIKTGDYIGDYTGEKLPLAAREDKSRDRDYFVETMDGFIIDGKDMNNKMRWINDPRHSKHLLNAEFQQRGDGTVSVRATRIIPKDREIFICYGDMYWKAADQERLKKWLSY